MTGTLTVRVAKAPMTTLAKSRRKRLASPSREYFVEYNRCESDRPARLVRRLERIGLQVERSPHKTSLRIERRTEEVSFAQMQKALRQGIDPKIGSVILFSPSTGGVWIMQNRGNRPGVFVRQNQL